MEATFSREMISPPFERPWMRVSCSTLDCRAFEDVTGEMDADRFEREHAAQHPVCANCNEFLDDEDRAHDLLVCTPCRIDQPEEAEAAVKRAIEAMSITEILSHLNHERKAS